MPCNNLADSRHLSYAHVHGDFNFANSISINIAQGSDRIWRKVVDWRMRVSIGLRCGDTVFLYALSELW